MGTKILYQGKIRDGQFGNFTDEIYKICEEIDTGLIYLEPFPEIDYTDDKYRESVNGENSVANYYKLHEENQLKLFTRLYPYLKRNQSVADIGCGGGIFLDLAKSLDCSTIGVEPNFLFFSFLQK